MADEDNMWTTLRQAKFLNAHTLTFQLGRDKTAFIEILKEVARTENDETFPTLCHLIFGKQVVWRSEYWKDEQPELARLLSALAARRRRGFGPDMIDLGGNSGTMSVDDVVESYEFREE